MPRDRSAELGPAGRGIGDPPDAGEGIFDELDLPAEGFEARGFLPVDVELFVDLLELEVFAEFNAGAPVGLAERVDLATEEVVGVAANADEPLLFC